jgi:hypothetical protein
LKRDWTTSAHAQLKEKESTSHPLHKMHLEDKFYPFLNLTLKETTPDLNKFYPVLNLTLEEAAPDKNKFYPVLNLTLEETTPDLRRKTDAHMCQSARLRHTGGGQ